MAVWIVVADSYRARIFSAEQASGPISEISTLVHTESRLKEQKRLQGSAAASHVAGIDRHRLEPRKTAVDHEVTLFAKQISECLDAGRNENRFKRFYLMAAPAMLGSIRKHLSAATSKMLTSAINKEHTADSPEQIRACLPKKL